MKTRSHSTKPVTLVICIVLLAVSVGAAKEKPQAENWIATWGAPMGFLQSPPLPSIPGFPQMAASDFENQTVRMVARISMGGSRFRIRLSNAFGNPAITIDAVHAAIQTEGSAINPQSDRAVLFGGKPSVVLLPGVELLSDPFELNAPELTHLAISLFIAGKTGASTVQPNGSVISYVPANPGDLTAAPDFEKPTSWRAYYWLSGIDVVGSQKASTIVAVGDSITAAGNDEDWPAVLATRLAADKRTRNLAVVNMGIAGNRVLSEGMGSSALGRFERHVLAQSGVRWIILLEGINDIGIASLPPRESKAMPFSLPPFPGGILDSSAIINGYRQIIAKAHSHNIKVMGCTIVPYKGANYYRENMAKVRQEVNQWIRTSDAFDAVADFDAAVRDSVDPEKIRDDMHRGDHLHPNAIGEKAMADAINLSVFGQER